MSREEFIQHYAKNSGITVDELLWKMNAYPCKCQDPKCPGWQMLTHAGARVAEKLGLINLQPDQ